MSDSEEAYECILSNYDNPTFKKRALLVASAKLNRISFDVEKGGNVLVNELRLLQTDIVSSGGHFDDDQLMDKVMGCIPRKRYAGFLREMQILRDPTNRQIPNIMGFHSSSGQLRSIFSIRSMNKRGRKGVGKRGKRQQ
jgi:hypothetical protein